jgi:hypothetical protein
MATTTAVAWGLVRREKGETVQALMCGVQVSRILAS